MIEHRTTPWFDRQVFDTRAPLRLFCVPHAGGNSTLFQGWSAWLQGVADVCPVHLPGRGTRLAEPAYVSLPPAVEAIAEAMRPFCHRPFALLGYSMGALIAYELARALEAQRRPPKALIVTACAAPPLIRTRRPTWQLPTSEFLQEIQSFNGTPPELLTDPKTMELFLPALRADFQLFETYVPVAGPPLACPIAAYGGADDQHASREQMQPWGDYTRGRFTIETFPGDHFFLRTSQARMMRSLDRVLTP